MDGFFLFFCSVYSYSGVAVGYTQSFSTE